VLEPTPDILAGLGADKPSGQVLVGFAAETDDLLENAGRKLRAKRLDLIVANDVGAPGVGFQHDTNAVTLLRPGIEPRSVGLRGKDDIAHAVLDAVAEIRLAAVHSEPPPTDPEPTR
jgi:phosphopantothenoylcysteine decarboxylase / phosphopantothenate---cysteine ligase